MLLQNAFWFSTPSFIHPAALLLLLFLHLLPELFSFVALSWHSSFPEASVYTVTRLAAFAFFLESLGYVETETQTV